MLSLFFSIACAQSVSDVVVTATSDVSTLLTSTVCTECQDSELSTEVQTLVSTEPGETVAPSTVLVPSVLLNTTVVSSPATEATAGIVSYSANNAAAVSGSLMLLAGLMANLF